MTTDLIDIRPEVHAGVALLKGDWPGWWMAIDPDHLNMRACSSCVLGQLYGDYDKGADRFGLDAEATRVDAASTAEMGFDSSRTLADYNQLGNEWLAVIAALWLGTYDPEVSAYPRYVGEGA